MKTLTHWCHNANVYDISVLNNETSPNKAYIDFFDYSKIKVIHNKK